jgi:multidrug resistance efflux pump
MSAERQAAQILSLRKQLNEHRLSLAQVRASLAVRDAEIARLRRLVPESEAFEQFSVERDDDDAKSSNCHWK